MFSYSDHDLISPFEVCRAHPHAFLAFGPALEVFPSISARGNSIEGLSTMNQDLKALTQDMCS